jgi:hypothetical protein
MTNNTDLLNLHSRQQNPQCTGEKRVTVSSWMKCLARAVDNKLIQQQDIRLLKKSDSATDIDARLNNIGHKLDALAKVLNLNSYDNNVLQSLRSCSLLRVSPLSYHHHARCISFIFITHSRAQHLLSCAILTI